MAESITREDIAQIWESMGTKRPSKTMKEQVLFSDYINRAKLIRETDLLSAAVGRRTR